MRTSIRFFGIIILFGLFFLIRAFEANLFYDPLIDYFKNDYLYKAPPKLDKWRLVLNLLFRYLLNSLISLGIIYLIFKKEYFVKFSGFFLMVAFIVLVFVFGLLLNNSFDSGYLFPFYIRRFIIQPFFLFLLIPAFYYQIKNNTRKFK